MNKIKEEALKLEYGLVKWVAPRFNTGAIRFYHRIGAVSESKERFILEISK